MPLGGEQELSGMQLHTHAAQSVPYVGRPVDWLQFAVRLISIVDLCLPRRACHWGMDAARERLDD